ncbi:MAG TPA: S9 family peptidase [Caulobacteraceae bacterium]|jgi:dipeptidyl aminopeptidase/acylaminoacyl peptidase|nr:S9 family peptidase [Caulobacteraceae bacterium]
MRAVAASAGLIALALAAKAAPVLEGPPPRALTDPAAIVSPVNREARQAPIADLFFVRGVADAAWSPDGQWIVFSTNFTGRYNLWRVRASGGFPEQLTVSDDRQGGLAITPAGAVLFDADLAGAEIYDIWRTPLAGGASVNVTTTPEVSETGARVSPDGAKIAFDRRPKTAPSTDVAVMDLATGAVRVLTHEAAPDRSWRTVGFTGDGRTLIADRGDFNDREAAVWSIDVATGQAKALSAPSGAYVAAAAVSPDGRWAAVTFETQAGVRQAGLLDVASGAVTPLRPDAWEQDAEDFSPDGRLILFSSNVDGRRTLFAYDLAAKTSRALPLPAGVSSLASSGHQSFSPDGRRLLVSHQGSNASPDLCVADLAAWTSAPLTRLGLASLSPAGLPTSQIVHYRSADGTVVSAFLWMPFNLARDGRAPGIVLPHGGPTGQTTDTFNRTALALASRGYVILAPNPRGSTGYGRAFQDANHMDLGGGDLEDEAAGAKFLGQTGYVDARRIGITGGSYGGYMTLMAVAKTPSIWAAGVEQYGIIDWRHMYVTEAPTLQQYQRGLLGDPDHDAAVYAASSPMTFMHQTTAPLLVLQGDNDIRVPRTQAEQVVATLKADGRTVDAHFYPNEGHGFVKRENQIDALERTVAWFDKYLKEPPK